ncbi:hypothetical protein COCON_G00000550 [Conger conger]|uniref:Gap junction protein n=1 Tax=Conger conger TaxID=82655 RepID=A0A9Q1E0I1_CONCO|nr:hypothetical protein COCON_G00000550 [Conger conger]
MSKADWTFLGLLLEQGQENSTGVGQVWLTVFFLCRVLVLSTAAESVWEDEQSDFVCNTLQPGCGEVCYDKAFPISHFRFFILQVIAVAAPAIFYLSYATLHASRERKRMERQEEEEEERRKKGEAERENKERRGEKGRKPRLQGGLLRVYLCVSALKLAVEAAFILALWRLYGFTVPAHYGCQRWPCPHTVDCFVSRPTEKTVFTVYMQLTAGASLLLNLLEVCVLVRRCVAAGDRAPPPRAPPLGEGPPPPAGRKGCPQVGGWDWRPVRF